LNTYQGFLKIGGQGEALKVLKDLGFIDVTECRPLSALRTLPATITVDTSTILALIYVQRSTAMVAP